MERCPTGDGSRSRPHGRVNRDPIVVAASDRAQAEPRGPARGVYAGPGATARMCAGSKQKTGRRPLRVAKPQSSWRRYLRRIEFRAFESRGRETEVSGGGFRVPSPTVTGSSPVPATSIIAGQTWYDVCGPFLLSEATSNLLPTHWHSDVLGGRGCYDSRSMESVLSWRRLVYLRGGCSRTT